MVKLNQCKGVFFDEVTHTYVTEDGVELMGVTSLMREQGVEQPYVGVDEHVLNHAAARGTALHKVLEHYDNGEGTIPVIRVSDNEGGEVEFDVSKQLALYTKQGYKVLASEYLISDNESIASSIDKVIDNGTEDSVDLGDVKFRSSLDRKAGSWQLSIYAYLFEKLNPHLKVRKLFLLHFTTRSTFKEVEVERIPTEKVRALIDAHNLGITFEDDSDTPVSLEAILGPIDSDEIVELSVKRLALQKELKSIEMALKLTESHLYEWMLANNKDTVEAPDGGTFTLKRPYMRKSVDTEAMKKDGIYEKYAVEKETSGSVTYKAAK